MKAFLFWNLEQREMKCRVEPGMLQLHGLHLKTVDDPSPLYYVMTHCGDVVMDCIVLEVS